MRRNKKPRCLACYACPMGVVGCDDDRIPHGHGGGTVCEECGIPYYKVHPHSRFCSKGTPITNDVEHDAYILRWQLRWRQPIRKR